MFSTFLRNIVRKVIKNKAKIRKVLRVVAYAVVVAVEAVKTIAAYSKRQSEPQPAL
jgi:hypothetical protein